MYTKCLPICLAGCMWVHACGSSASIMLYFHRWHNYLTFCHSFFFKIRGTFKDFNGNLQRFSHCWLNSGPSQDERFRKGHDPASFLDLPGRERLIPGMVKVVDSLDTQLVSGSISGRASHFQSFDGSWGWKWRCTGVVCLPQVVNNNKAEMKKLCTDFCVHTKCTGNIFPWDIHSYILQDFNNCQNLTHSEYEILIFPDDP